MTDLATAHARGEHIRSVPHPDHPGNPRITLGVCTEVPGCAGCERSVKMQEIHKVWTTGNRTACVLLWSLQDGYGEPGYVPSQGYDWSGIRDSSDSAVHAMWTAIHA
jgi:hypothetical protein